jgi:XTP/dITP diphosphohydrolase
MRKLLIATQNKGKQKEIRALLDDLPVEFLTPDQLNLASDIFEDGQTYKENATKKVNYYAQAAAEIMGVLTLADDSGLEVDVLNGQPGLHSARFSKKPGATDADRRAYLLDQLKNHPRPWTARFRCVVALHDPGSGLHFSEGICPGKIIPEERGDYGFGYDPIFLMENMDHTMAELSMDKKNRLSHRARAVHAIKPMLAELLKRQYPPQSSCR